MLKRSSHYIIVCLALLISCLDAFSQEKKAEGADRYQDFKQKSIANPSGTVDQLLNDAGTLKESNPREALNKVEEALGLSIAAGDKRNEGRSYVLIGQINEQIQEWKLALDNYQNAYDRLKDKYASEAIFRDALFGLAEMNLKLSNLELALKYFQEVDGKRRLSQNEVVRAKVGISEVYLQQGKYTEALTVLSEKISSGKVSDGATEVRIQNQRAKVFSKMNELDNARLAIQSSQNTLRSAPASASQPRPEDDLDEAKEQVADALHDQQRYDEEIAVRNEAIQFNLESKNLPEVTRDKVGLSKAFAAKGETSEAIRELEEAALMADTTNNPKDQAKAFLSLADIYEKNGRQGQALDAYRKYSQAVTKSESLNETRLTEKADLIQRQRDIEQLTKDLSLGQKEETIAQQTVGRQQLVIYGLVAIILIIAVTSYFIYRNAQASKIANQMLALKSLRSQMNPHFIFNALNSVNQFIAQEDERTANKFLSEFSRLMRLVLENSQEDFIPLTKEQEIIALYLKLEHYRFRDKFEYEIHVDESINAETIEIPPMLIQPYIENAVWHGLRYKENKGRLCLAMKKLANGIEVEITDDGIGRKRSAELKTENQKKHQSTGIKNIEQRLQIISNVYKVNYHVKISDLNGDGRGTRVVIHLPEHKNGHA